MRKPCVRALSFLPAKADPQEELLISRVTSFLVRIFYCSVKFIVLLRLLFLGTVIHYQRGRGAMPVQAWTAPGSVGTVSH